MDSIITCTGRNDRPDQRGSISYGYDKAIASIISEGFRKTVR
jgi:hypothetical protein